MIQYVGFKYRLWFNIQNVVSFYNNIYNVVTDIYSVYLLWHLNEKKNKTRYFEVKDF